MEIYMNNNKPKKAVIGESRVMHVGRGFAIPVIVVFASFLLIFNFGWLAVLGADAIADFVVNPIISYIDPEAERIDIMEKFDPPTSESHATKIKAEFPILFDEAEKAKINAAIEAFPSDSFSNDKGLFTAFNDLRSWIFNDIGAAVMNVAGSIFDKIHTYPAEIELWYKDHLPFRSIISNANSALTAKIEENYPEIQIALSQRLKNAERAYNILMGNDSEENNPIFGNNSDQNNFLNNDSVAEGGDMIDTENNDDEEEIEGNPDNLDKDPEDEGVLAPGDDDDELQNDFITETDGEEVFVTEESETLPPSEDFTEESEETLPEYTQEEEDTNACEHEYVDKGYEIEPTCAELGVGVKECTACGRVERYYVQRVSHVKDDGKVTVEPTCSEFGQKEYSCTVCQKLLSREYIAKVAHVKNEDGRIVKEASCTENGLMEYNCVNCNTVLSTKDLAKLPHTKDGGTVTKQATCDEYGEMTYLCTVCGAVISTERIAKTEHKYISIEKTDALTCGCRSKETFECTNCQNQYSKTAVKKHVAGETLGTVDPSYTTYGYTLIRCADCGGEYRTARKNKYYDTSYALPINRSDTVMEGRYKWLFYRGNDSQAYYEGTNLMTDAELAEYVSVMTTLNELCKERGITLQICIWPNKEQVYPEYVTWVPETQDKRVDRLVKYVQENSDVKIIYPLQDLKDAKSYYDVYFQYDTHWNNAGGYIGYQAMLESLGLQTTSINNMPVYKFTGAANSGPNTDPYLGAISDMIGLGKLNAADYTDNFNYYVKYRPDVRVDTFEGKNGAGDYRHTTAANAPNDLNFVMLADSYRVMQLSYLEKDFTDCTLDHRNHVNNDNVKDAIKNSDILVIAAVERLEPDILTTAKHIINILQEE